MKSSLIISVYKNTADLKVVLDGLSFQTDQGFEIIVSEDGESPEMSEFVASYPFKNDYQHLTQPDVGWKKPGVE